MTALIFNQKGARSVFRQYKTKTGTDMVVIPMLILETGGLIEQHFTYDDYLALDLQDQYFFSASQPSVVELETEDVGMNKKIVNIVFKGKLDYKVK